MLAKDPETLESRPSLIAAACKFLKGLFAHRRKQDKQYYKLEPWSQTVRQSSGALG